MKKLSREKIALIIFALLVVCGFGALMFYITNIGHSFNVTASTIDDAAGDLGDYTAIIYEGTAEEKKALGDVSRCVGHRDAQPVGAGAQPVGAEGVCPAAVRRHGGVVVEEQRGGLRARDRHGQRLPRVEDTAAFHRCRHGRHFRRAGGQREEGKYQQAGQQQTTGFIRPHGSGSFPGPAFRGRVR